MQIKYIKKHPDAIPFKYSREGDATWDFQKKLKESDRDAF